jgi:hypothetical protein
MFNIKKGSITVYISNWLFKFNQNNSVSYYNSLANYSQVWYTLFLHKYQFTSLTSRLTSYVLLSFWIFFFFFGETLLLVLFNYSTPIDTICSSNFLTIKQHVIFFIDSSSSKLLYYINFFIFFFTLNAFFYMINLTFTYNYRYFFYSTLNSILIITLSFMYIFIL